MTLPQDFELNSELKMRVIGFLEEVMHDPELLTQERKAAANIIRLAFPYRHFIAHTGITYLFVSTHMLKESFVLITIEQYKAKIDSPECCVRCGTIDQMKSTIILMSIEVTAIVNDGAFLFVQIGR